MKNYISFGFMFLLLIGMISATTTEERLTQIEKRLDALEGWQITVNNFMAAISEFIGENNNMGLSFCEAIKICEGDVACNEDIDCGRNFYLSDVCIDDTLNSQQMIFECAFPGTKAARCSQYIGIDIMETCEYGCESGECLEKIDTLVPVYIPGNKLIFDLGLDGDMDCYDYKTFFRSYTPRYPQTIGVTPQGYNIIKYGSNGEVMVRTPTNEIFTPVSCN